MVQAQFGRYPPLLTEMDFLTTFLSTALIDATGEKVAIIGRIVIPGGGSKAINRVGFRFGAVTKAGGSALTVSLQDVSLTATPIQPDETQDQTVAIANADAGFTSDAWYRTNALSANRTLSHGDYVAVVIEFDGAGRLGADSVVISAVTASNGRARNLGEAITLKVGGAWTEITNSIPDVVLEDTNGEFFTISSAIVASTLGQHNWDNGTTPDEYAIKIVPPVQMYVDQLYACLRIDAGANFDLLLIGPSGVMATASIDADAIHVAATTRYYQVPIAEQRLDKGETYYVSVRPSTTNNLRLQYAQVSVAGHLENCWPGGTTDYQASRVDGGAWSDANTIVPFVGVVISGFSDRPAQLVNNAGLVG